VLIRKEYIGIKISTTEILTIEKCDSWKKPKMNHVYLFVVENFQRARIGRKEKINAAFFH
jgi:hypothetical protein